MTVAALRALHVVIGSTIDEIEREPRDDWHQLLGARGEHRTQSCVAPQSWGSKHAELCASGRANYQAQDFFKPIGYAHSPGARICLAADPVHPPRGRAQLARRRGPKGGRSSREAASGRQPTCSRTHALTRTAESTHLAEA
ncbi:hypothetical protein C8Q80DRAFT_1214181 [Daedaleopsis nitida]|nr:hypothetical protein C8Q80DRAFT_1214181 [Daedaleopsis nitida]